MSVALPFFESLVPRASGLAAINLLGTAGVTGTVGDSTGPLKELLA